MVLFIGDFFINVFVPSFVTLLIIIYGYFKWSFQYWKRQNIPQIDPVFPWGNMRNPLYNDQHEGELIREQYKEMKNKGHKHFGIYNMATPIYTVVDLEYVKLIMLKDFDYFVDRFFYVNEKDDPIGAHLFAIGGEKWRTLRTKLTPTFTSGKMKSMFSILVNVGSIMEQYLKEMELKKDAVNIKNILACYTTDIIGSCAFGLDCNTFKEPDSPFRKFGNKVFNHSVWRQIELTFAFGCPKLGRLLHLRQIEKDVSDFYTKIVSETVRYREENNISRKDFLQILIDLKKDNILNLQEIVAQCFIFFVAGFETSSTTMTFALFELSVHQDVQDRLREEVNEVLKRYDGKVTYEAVNEMKYMDQVINETLRKYPPLPFVMRECVKDYKLPNEGVIIQKGTLVLIPILGIHYDKEYYKNPEDFDPERFSLEQKMQRHQFAHIPFGEGPRICIGMRFGLIQTKVGIIHLLRKYKFTLNDRTKLPLKMDPKSFTLTAKGDIWLNIQHIEN